MIVAITYIPSPYQVELFDALSRAVDGRLRVVYVTRAAPGRQWSLGHLNHAHCILSEGGTPQAIAWTREARLVIFGAYQQPAVRSLIEVRFRAGKPWAFWGERPGAVLRGWAGRFARALRQRRLRTSRAPVWGIGAWAIEGYKAELGEDRLFVNLPYFSDLDRYLAIDRRQPASPGVRFLFSGSLIPRKGVDLLAKAFARLASSGSEVTLSVVGGGPLAESLRAATSDCRSRVEFLGFRQWRELPEHYARADVLCAPSRYDGWGLVVPEGLAAGMPVISTDRTGAARELIGPANGWLIPADDAEALTRAMKTAAALAPERRAEMSCRARESAKRQNLAAGVERFLAAVELTLEDCARRRSGPKSMANAF